MLALSLFWQSFSASCSFFTLASDVKIRWGSFNLLPSKAPQESDPDSFLIFGRRKAVIDQLRRPSVPPRVLRRFRRFCFLAFGDSGSQKSGQVLDTGTRVTTAVSSVCIQNRTEQRIIAIQRGRESYYSAEVETRRLVALCLRG
jgi:hypothetical protein